MPEMKGGGIEAARNSRAGGVGASKAGGPTKEKAGPEGPADLTG
jgi:hypothetical protein